MGNLKKTPEGYYPMIVGALGVYNSGGAFYPLEASRQLFEDQSSAFQRRVGRGALRGENGHPKPPAMTTNDAQNEIIMQEFVRRNLSIYEENVICHHAKIWLDFDSVKDKNGKPVVAIMSWVMPDGPHGHVLEKQLNNPLANVCFSIRSFTDNKMRFGVEERTIREIVTFDYVNEPGIAVAEKYFAPALESHNDFEMSLSRGTIEKAIYQDSVIGISNESVKITGESLMNALGWSLPNLGDSRAASLRW